LKEDVQVDFFFILEHSSQGSDPHLWIPIFKVFFQEGETMELRNLISERRASALGWVLIRQNLLKKREGMEG